MRTIERDRSGYDRDGRPGRPGAADLGGIVLCRWEYVSPFVLLSEGPRNSFAVP